MSVNYHLKRGLFYSLIIAMLSCSRRMLFSGRAQVIAAAEDVLLVAADILICWIVCHFFLEDILEETERRRWAAIKPIMLSLLVLVAINISVSILNQNPYYADLQPADPGMRVLSISSTSLLISVFCYLLVYYELISKRLKSSLIENEQLKQAQMRAELSLLQQQLSPHFLFNSLGTLKAIAPDEPTKYYIHQLAQVYRYLLKFNEQLLVMLKDELEFLNAYLYILKERFENALIVEVAISPDKLKLSMPSLALQTLVENAIKHNSATEDAPLKIRIFSSGEGTVTVENNYQPRRTAYPGPGNGLRNLRDRYRLIAGRELAIAEIGSTFSVTLPLI